MFADFAVFSFDGDVGVLGDGGGTVDDRAGCVDARLSAKVHYVTAEVTVLPSPSEPRFYFSKLNVLL